MELRVIVLIIVDIILVLYLGFLLYSVAPIMNTSANMQDACTKLLQSLTDKAVYGITPQKDSCCALYYNNTKIDADKLAQCYTDAVNKFTNDNSVKSLTNINFLYGKNQDPPKSS